MALGGGEEGADMFTLEVDDVSDETRSMSFSKGLSSSKVSIAARCACAPASVGQLCGQSVRCRSKVWAKVWDQRERLQGYVREYTAAYAMG